MAGIRKNKMSLETNFKQRTESSKITDSVIRRANRVRKCFSEGRKSLIQGRPTEIVREVENPQMPIRYSKMVKFVVSKSPIRHPSYNTDPSVKKSFLFRQTK